jgi:hypothetical protein
MHFNYTGNLKNNSISYKKVAAKILFIYLNYIHSINLIYISIYTAYLYKYCAYKNYKYTDGSNSKAVCKKI